jgi:hypothetical protein
MRPIILCAIVLVFSPLVARAQSLPVMPDFIRRYHADARDVARFYALNWNEERFDRLRALYDEYLVRLEAMPYEDLGVDDRIDWHLLRRHLLWRKRTVELDRGKLAEMDSLMPFRRPIQALELTRRRMEGCDPREAAARLAEISDAARSVRERVERGRRPEGERSDDAIVVTPVVARRAAGALDDLVETLDRWARFYDEFDPAFAWWTRRPLDDARREIRDLARFLREEIAGIRGRDDDPLIGDPIGAEALAADLEGESIAYTPDELITIGERELAWTRQRLIEAARELGLGDDWRGAIARAKENHVPPGEQDELVRDEARAVIRFLRERDLLTIPPLCEEAWRVEMHDVERQRTLPYAVYGGQYMGVSYAAGSMPHADKLMAMRGNNRHFTHIVTPHELIPGHHLQGFMEDRERPYRSIFSTPFLVEGWALYWEFRLWDLGWAGATGNDAALDRVGMLFWRAHRAARIIVSLRFHLGRMTPPEMVDFLVNEVGHERTAATAEVRRYIGGDYSPLYQSAYMLGGIQISAMHAELVGRKQMTDRAFNDAVLTQNSIPIELMRAAIRGDRLPKDWKPAWRFAD